MRALSSRCFLHTSSPPAAPVRLFSLTLSTIIRPSQGAMELLGSYSELGMPTFCCTAALGYCKFWLRRTCPKKTVAMFPFIFNQDQLMPIREARRNHRQFELLLHTMHGPRVHKNNLKPYTSSFVSSCLLYSNPNPNSNPNRICGCTCATLILSHA